MPTGPAAEGKLKSKKGAKASGKPSAGAKSASKQKCVAPSEVMCGEITAASAKPETRSKHFAEDNLTASKAAVQNPDLGVDVLEPLQRDMMVACIDWVPALL